MSNFCFKNCAHNRMSQLPLASRDGKLSQLATQSEIDKGALSRGDEGVEDAGKLKRVKDKKEEDLAESEDPQNQ